MRFRFLVRTKPHKATQRPAQNRTKPLAASCAAFKCAVESRMPSQTQPLRGTHAATPALSQNWYQSVGNKKEGGRSPPKINPLPIADLNLKPFVLRVVIAYLYLRLAGIL